MRDPLQPELVTYAGAVQQDRDKPDGQKHGHDRRACPLTCTPLRDVPLNASRR